jgi:hypothetical protein
MSIWRRWVALGVMAIAMGCASIPQMGINVTSDHDPSFSFTGRKTYGWLPHGATPVLGLDDDFLDARIRSAVEGQLNAKGFRRRQPGTVPDFGIGYKVDVERGRIDTLREYSAYRDTGGTQMPTSAYVGGFEEAVLFVRFVNPLSRKPVWLGTARAVFSPDKFTGAKRAERINKAVAEMLVPFPPP